ncbi:MAG: Lpg1974 family pore-forming outer membrane protein [Chlamydiae bacterium]|nr:Lpg1974 family pore-forming outer membrane protein [Chlamydiota bacterium]
MTVPFYNLECDFGQQISIDFLYWFAKENGLSYATRIIAAPRIVGGGTRPVSDKDFYFDADFDPGFRLGMGYHTPNDHWDIDATWTYFHNKVKASKRVSPHFGEGLPTVEGQETLVNYWNDGSLLTTTMYDSIKTRWDLNFNLIDLSLGRKFWVSKKTTLTPFVALRGSWTRIRFFLKGLRDVVDPEEGLIFSINNKTNLFNHYWGVGFVAGANSSWHFVRNFSIFGSADFSLLWGKFSFTRKNRFSDTSPLLSTFDISNHTFGMQPILDLALGFRWESNLGRRCHIALDTGWEYHFWINHVKRKTFHRFGVESAGVVLVDVPILDFIQNDLVLSGLVARLRLDF